MKRVILIAGACALFAAPALAQTSSSPSTQDFIKQAAISGMFEIESSKLALEKKVPADRHFAEHMIRDHKKMAAQLEDLVRADHIKAELPTALDDEHNKMLDKLRSENGESFDKDYDQMQQQGHEQAVSLFQAYAQNGDNPALKRWAAKTLPTLQQHLAMAQKLS